MAETQLYRRIRADARKVDSAVSRAGNAGDAGIERVIQNHTHIGARAGTRQHQKTKWEKGFYAQGEGASTTLRFAAAFELC